MMRLKLLIMMLAIAMVAPSAHAQGRGRSGLPAGPGNPFAALGAAAGGAERLAVYDGVGQKVGDVVGVLDMSVPLVALDVQGRQFVLRVTANHLYGVRVVFEAPSCAGTPLLTAPFLDSPNPVTTVLSLAGVAGPGHTVYVAEPNAVGQFVQFRSRLTLDGACISSSFTSPATVVPAVQLVDLDTLFSTPYSVR
jgi:hypothetical protein